jgi:hypothetical protein
MTKSDCCLSKTNVFVTAVLGFVLLFMLPTLSSSLVSALDVAPAPPSIGAAVPLTYFGPAPSMVQRELIGPYQLLKAGQVDLNAGTITLPLYQGHVKVSNTGVETTGTAATTTTTTTKKVWYMLTDTDDKGAADLLGLNWSPKLSYASHGVRNATIARNATLLFNEGTVDFKPVHMLTPGSPPNSFPPQAFRPGSVGDKDYTPLVRIENAGNHIYNAPIVAFDVNAKQISFCNGNPDYSLVHDKVVKICPEQGTVTIKLTSGFSFARPVLYLSTDTSNPIAASMESATFSVKLGAIATGHDDSAFSAVERLFAFINGPTGKDNPQRQGFNSALTDGLSPLNVLGGIPTIATDYSPIWDLNIGQWTQKAIDNGYRSRLIEEFQILGFVEKGWITGPGGAPYGSAGIAVNCPIVYRFL